MNMQPKILFINYYKKSCGVYQYGLNIYNALRRSSLYDFQYLEVGSIEEVNTALGSGLYSAAIFNYHPGTLNFLPKLRQNQIPHIGLLHENNQSSLNLNYNYFTHYIIGDPTIDLSSYRNIYRTGRIIWPYDNKQVLPKITTIGTFGFATPSKGYQRLVSYIQDNLEEAIIRIHIPKNDVCDPNLANSLHQFELCRRLITKPGIKLEVSTNFMSHEELIDWLGSNTINAFLYDYLQGPNIGISSSVDYGITARRPVVITKSYMFRHLFGLPITAEDNKLSDIIKNGNKPFEHLYEKWKPKNLLNQYEEILCSILNQK